MLGSNAKDDYSDDEDDVQCDICNARCCQDTLEIFQVTDQNVILQTRKIQGHSRQFCAEWYKKFPWLVLCTTRFRAFCAYCCYGYRRKLPTDKLGEATFVTIGYDNWKKAVEHLNQHALSSLHKESLLKIELMKVVPIDTQINAKLKIDQQNRRDMLLVVIKSLKYLLRQGLAIRGHEEIEGNLMQLLLLQSKHCSKLKQYIDDNHYLSNRIINEIISEMGKSVVQTYLTEIRQAMVFYT